MTANAETPAGPDIVVRLLNHVKELAIEYTEAECPEITDMTAAAKAIEYLRAANLRLIADNNRLSAELRAARGEEGR